MTEQEERERYRYLQLKQKAMSGGQTSKQEQGFKVPPIAQKVGQFFTGPGRLTRGIGVGAEALLSGKPPLEAGTQAASAMQPGFQPQPGQKLGSFVGGLADPLNYLMPGGVEASGLRGMAKAGGLSGLSSGFNALMDQMSQGKVQPKSLASSAILGTATGGLTQSMRKAPAAFVQNAPQILDFTSKAPKRAVSIFANNPSMKIPGREEAEIAVSEKSEGVMKALKEAYQNADSFFKGAAKKAGVTQTARQRLSSGTIPAAKIPKTLSVVEERIRQLKARASTSASALDEWENGTEQSKILRTLINIRTSLQKHGWGEGTSQSGVSEINTNQQGGAKSVYHEVNEMIEGLPKGRFIRDADAKMSKVKDFYKKLQPLMERPGEAQKFLQDIFDGKGVNADEDLVILHQLETTSGKPVINDLWNAMTKSYFSQKLADNQIKRTIAGASPFLISAMLRVGGLPFQGAMMASAAGVTAMHSPRLQAAAIRGAEAAGPAIKKAAKPTAVLLQNALRKFREQQQ